METPFAAIRRMLQTTGAVYYGTDTFTYPIDIYFGAPVPALAPGTEVVVGYDFTCLLKDIRKTNCAGMPVSVWTVLMSVVVVVMAFCIVLVPVACIYRSGRFAGKSIQQMWSGGAKSNPYREIEQRAERNSRDMPVPPTVSQFRPGYNAKRSDELEEEEWE